jgi:hypothetical protein
MFDPTTDVPALSLVIPVYDAADQLPATLQAVDHFAAQYPDRLEVLFVDDCSTDVDVRLSLEEFAGAREGVRVLRNAHNRGKGYSVTRGMLAARGRYRVFTDVDLAYPLDQVHRIVGELARGADVAIACRVLPESRYLMSPSFFHYLYTRHLMSRAFNRVVQTFLLPGILDTQAGLKGFTASAAELCFGARRSRGSASTSSVSTSRSSTGSRSGRRPSPSATTRSRRRCASRGTAAACSRTSGRSARTRGAVGTRRRTRASCSPTRTAGRPASTRRRTASR